MPSADEIGAEHVYVVLDAPHGRVEEVCDHSAALRALHIASRETHAIDIGSMQGSMAEMVRLAKQHATPSHVFLCSYIAQILRPCS